MQNPLAKAGMLRIAATYATFEHRTQLREANAKPPDEAEVVEGRIAADLALQVASTLNPRWPERFMAAELEREPARKQREDCQDDQGCYEPDEQPFGAIHQEVISRVQ